MSQEMAETGKVEVEKADSGKALLHTFCHSSCGWRVRLALDFKGIPYDIKSYNVNTIYSEEYKAINPLSMVPALEIDGGVLVDSLAIIEYLEEKYPEKPLLPSDLKKKAAIRLIVNMVVSSIQPLQNLRVLQGIEKLAGPDVRLEWAQQWIVRGFEAMETILKKTSGKYCFGDEITLADIVLVPQMNNAVRYKVDLTPFPTLVRLRDSLYELELIQNSTPDKQPDYVKVPSYVPYVKKMSDIGGT